MNLVLDELEDCIADKSDVEAVIDQQETARIISEFLDGLSVTERSVFLRRYWYMEPIARISESFGFSQSKITSMLHRTRKKLRQKLESESLL